MVLLHGAGDVLEIVVLPALGGDTMRQRCPLPMGDTSSMARVV
jgi:hypothetical protein